MCIAFVLSLTAVITLYYSILCTCAFAFVICNRVEVCLVNVSDMRSLEFTVKRIMIKLFRTYDNGIINSNVSFFWVYLQ